METKYPTPQALFDAIEQKMGAKLSQSDKMLMMVTVMSGQATPEQIFAIATHDCPNCPKYDSCTNPRKTKREDAEESDETVPDVFADFIKGDLK